VAWRWPAVQQYLVNLGAAGMSFDLNIGQRETIFELARSEEADQGVPVRIVTPICFEATVPGLCRRLVYSKSSARPLSRSADIIVNLSNDGWFGEVIGIREHHLQIARWRCVELGVPMVRCVNTGISCVIDPQGRIVDRINIGGTDKLRDGVMTAKVTLPPREASTLYGRIGDIFGWSTMWLTAAGVLYMLVRAEIARRREKRRAAKANEPTAAA
jgi:apolipoprotein N-acyltransferase